MSEQEQQKQVFESMQQVGHRVGTDKVTYHGYHQIYQSHIDNQRGLAETLNDASPAIFEVGIDRGASVALWRALLPAPRWKILGMDIGVEHVDEKQCLRIVKGDQSRTEDLRRVVDLVVREHQHQVRIVNDDGSHIPEHQILTFDILFRDMLQPRGVYLLEDIETSYWTKGDCYGYPTAYGFRHPLSVVEQFRSIVDVVNMPVMKPDDRRALLTTASRQTGISPETLSAIESITFARNCIIVTKKGPDHAAYDTRSYLNAHHW